MAPAVAGASLKEKSPLESVLSGVLNVVVLPSGLVLVTASWRDAAGEREHAVHRELAAHRARGRPVQGQRGLGLVRVVVDVQLVAGRVVDRVGHRVQFRPAW